MDNLMPGSDWILALDERNADVYDQALARAWEDLADLASDGVGWDMVEDTQDVQAAFVFRFRDLGGYDIEITVDPWEEPCYD